MNAPMHPSSPKPDFKNLRVGRSYRVVKAFRDYDGNLHESGEVWTYRGHSFLPYEDGLTLFIDRSGQTVQPSVVRLQWRPESQADVIDHLPAYLEEIAEPPMHTDACR